MKVYFTIIVGRKFATLVGVQLIEGVHLIWGPLNTVFTEEFVPRYSTEVSARHLISFGKWRGGDKDARTSQFLYLYLPLPTFVHLAPVPC